MSIVKKFNTAKLKHILNFLFNEIIIQNDYINYLIFENTTVFIFY